MDKQDQLLHYLIGGILILFVVSIAIAVFGIQNAESIRSVATLLYMTISAFSMIVYMCAYGIAFFIVIRKLARKDEVEWGSVLWLFVIGTSVILLMRMMNFDFFSAAAAMQ